MSNSSIWPIDKTLSNATTPGQSGIGSNGNEGLHYILQSPRTEASSSAHLASYPGHLLRGVLPLYRDAASVFHGPSKLGWKLIE